MKRLQRIALFAGTGAAVLTLLAANHDPDFFRSYLAVFLFGLNISLGALAILMIHALTGGAWGMVIRPPLIAAARLLPLHAVLFLPLLPGLPLLYPWWPALAADADGVAAGQSLWLDSRFFVARAASYFLLWSALSRVWISLAAQPGRERALKAASAAGLLVYVFTVWFAGVDWIMSLMPRWYSSGFGLLLCAAQALGALAFAVLLAARGADGARHQPQTWNDLGNLLLTCSMLWMYLAFTQFLIIWAEDLPRETAWYWPRMRTSWVGLTAALTLLQFVIPFVLLLSRAIKRNPKFLGAIAAMIFAAQFLCAFYLVVPSLAPDGFAVRWTDASWLIALGGIWMAAWLQGLKGVQIP